MNANVHQKKTVPTATSILGEPLCPACHVPFAPYTHRTLLVS